MSQSFEQVTIPELRQELKTRGIEYKKSYPKLQLYNLLHQKEEKLWSQIPEKTTVYEIRRQLRLREIPFVLKMKKTDLLKLLSKSIIPIQPKDNKIHKFVSRVDLDEFLRANKLDIVDVVEDVMYSILPAHTDEKMSILNNYMAQFDVVYHLTFSDMDSKDSVGEPLIIDPPQFYTYSELSHILTKISGKTLEQLDMDEKKEMKYLYDPKSRTKIVDKINSYFSDDFRDKISSSTRVTNDKNLYLYTIDECPEKIVYFGTVKECRWYAEGELANNFKSTQRFIDVENKLEFSEDQALTLLSIASNGDMKSLYSVIRNIFENSLKLPSKQEKFMERLSHNRDCIPIFKQFFEIGMKMRGWRGKGEYPLKSKDTGYEGDPETQKQVSLAIVPFMNALDKLPKKDREAFDSLMVMTLEKGKYVLEKSLTLGDIIERSITGTRVKGKHKRPKSCIRITSKYIISSSLFYLNRIYSEIIEGVDLVKLEYIS